MKHLNSLWKLLYPSRCPVCDDIVPGIGSLICPKCRNRLVYVSGECCQKCGKALREEVDGQHGTMLEIYGETGRTYEESAGLCSDCRKKHHLFVEGAALYEYDCIRESVYRYKYGGRREYADFYGEEIARFLGNRIRAWRAQALVPVPLHPQKLKSRGYNQAHLLALRAGELLGVPVRDDLVARVKNTEPQKNLDPVKRQNNLKRAFKLCENDVKLKTIIIIDDIYTTGSTVDAVCRVFQETSVREIYFIALAIGKGV